MLLPIDYPDCEIPSLKKDKRHNKISEQYVIVYYTLP